MTIFFSAAQTDNLDFQKIYRDILVFLSQAGHSVHQAIDDDPKKYHRALDWISHCDAVVMEVSFPSSLQLGYQLTLAQERHKPVIALYQEGHRPSFFMSEQNDKLIWLEYQADAVQTALEDGLEYIAEQQDVRFNLLLSAKLNEYLDHVSQEQKISKSQFIRNLILEHKRNDVGW